MPNRNESHYGQIWWKAFSVWSLRQTEIKKERKKGKKCFTIIIVWHFLCTCFMYGKMNVQLLETNLSACVCVWKPLLKTRQDDMSCFVGCQCLFVLRAPPLNEWIRLNLVQLFFLFFCYYLNSWCPQRSQYQLKNHLPNVIYSRI